MATHLLFPVPLFRTYGTTNTYDPAGEGEPAYTDGDVTVRLPGVFMYTPTQATMAVTHFLFSTPFTSAALEDSAVFLQPMRVWWAA